MGLFSKKENKNEKRYRKVLSFYPKFPIFHYLNHYMYGDRNNETLLNRRFVLDTGYFPNLENPHSLNEKILWLSQYYQNPEMLSCSDDFCAKAYIAERLGEGKTAKILAEYKDVFEIDLDKLPSRFVLKVNWGWGNCHEIAIADKSEADINEIRAKLDDWIQPWNNFYYAQYDWNYKHIKPKIFAEEYLEKSKRYKLCCFNGKLQMTVVCLAGTETKKRTKTFFAPDWTLLPLKCPGTDIDEKVSCPECFAEMAKDAEKLAQCFPFFVVDFVIDENKAYITDLSFRLVNNFEAFEPREWDYKLGEMLQLPEKLITDKE